LLPWWEKTFEGGREQLALDVPIAAENDYRHDVRGR
jgi:hypothetical protein